MKLKKASGLLKRIVSLLISSAKAKTRALKTKTSALRTRLIIFSLLTNHKFIITSVSHKLQALTTHQHRDKKHNQDHKIAAETEEEKEEEEGEEYCMQQQQHGDQNADESNASTVLHNLNSISLPSPANHIQFLTAADHSQQHDTICSAYGYHYQEEEEEEEEDNNKYPDLTHSLFDCDDEGVSVIELVKKSKKQGEEFNLEEEIDNVADLFIRRFHRRMRLQKQLSLKRMRHQQKQQQQEMLLPSTA